eukprot:254130_1
MEMQNNHNNIKQEFLRNPTSILNSHMQLIKDLGQKYIKTIKSLLYEKTKESHTYFNSFQQNEIDNNDNDITIKEEIVVNEENIGENNSDSQTENIPIQNVIYVAGVNLKCVDCDELFGFHEDFQNHMAIEHDKTEPYKCNQCDKCYTSKVNVIMHIERKHQNKKNYECDICHKQFYQKIEWQDHCRIHRDDRPYKCNQCDKTFRQRQGLSVHIKCVHNKE